MAVKLGQQTSLLARYPELRLIYLKHLARYGNKMAAAAHIRCTQPQVFEFSRKNPDFADLEEQAVGVHKASIEEEIRRRAIDGVDEPRFGPGGVVGVVKRYSDQLLLAYARRHIPEYREQQKVEHAGAVEHKHEHVVDLKLLTEEQRAAMRLLLTMEEPEPETKLLKVEAEPNRNGRT